MTEIQREERRPLFDLLTVNEYAELKRVTRRTVERWIQRRAITAERIGKRGHWRIKVFHVERRSLS
jgi:excisionase family DNA binding protein